MRNPFRYRAPADQTRRLSATTSTTTRGWRRLALTALVAGGLATSALTPTETRAASPIGTSYAAEVFCDETGNFMSINARARAATGFSSQSIAYRVAIWDISRGRPVQGYWASGWGYFTHAYQYWMGSVLVTNPGPESAGWFNIGLPNGTYSVQTQYSFNSGGTWYTDPSWALTTAYSTGFYGMATGLCQI